MKYRVIQLLFLSWMLLGISQVNANSNIMHGAYSLDFFLRLEDDNFHPEIKDTDRKALSFQKGANGRYIFELSDAQISFILGANFPDSIPLMDLSHTVMPDEIINAIVKIHNVLPYEHEKELILCNVKDKSERDRRMADRRFILDQQRYIAMGAQIHFLTDDEIHPKLHKFGEEWKKKSILNFYDLSDHIRIEELRDEVMRDRLFETYRTKYKLNDEDIQNLRTLAEEYNAVNSPNMRGYDIKDAFLNMLLDVIEGDPFKHSSHALDSLGEIGGLKDLVSSGTDKRLKFPDYDSIPEELKLNGNRENEQNQQRIANYQLMGQSRLGKDMDTGEAIRQTADVIAAKTSLASGVENLLRNGKSVLTQKQRQKLCKGNNSDDPSGNGNSDTDETGGKDETGNGDGAYCSDDSVKSNRPKRTGLFQSKAYDVGGSSSGQKK